MRSVRSATWTRVDPVSDSCARYLETTVVFSNAMWLLNLAAQSARHLLILICERSKLGRGRHLVKDAMRGTWGGPPRLAGRTRRLTRRGKRSGPAPNPLHDGVDEP